jgi:hypothetical protein
MPNKQKKTEISVDPEKKSSKRSGKIDSPQMEQDLNTDGSHSEQTSQLSPEAQDIDAKQMNQFRKLLREYIDNLATDTSEIAVGLCVSRPVITRFLDKDNPQNHIPGLSRGRIINLWKILTDKEKLKVKNGVVEMTTMKRIIDPEKSLQEKKGKRKEAGLRRKILGEKGADELLIAAGFQPEVLKSVYVSKNQYSQMNELAFLLKGTSINRDLLFQLTQQGFSTHLERRNNGNKELRKNDESQDIEILAAEKLTDILDNTVVINNAVKENVKKKYEKACRVIKDDRHASSSSIHPTEQMSLLMNILTNELDENDQIDLRLRIVKYSSVPMSLEWERNPEWDLLVDEMRKIMIPDAESSLNEIGYDISSFVSKTSITCNLEGEENVEFNYISSGTPVETAITSILLGMGIQHDFSQMQLDIRCLDNTIKSLVKSSVVIRNIKEEEFEGSWVDSDMINSLLQSIIIAAKKSVKQTLVEHGIELVKYQKMLVDLARIRCSLNNKRAVFNTYNAHGVSLKDLNSTHEETIKCLREIDDNYNDKETYSNESNAFPTFRNNFLRLAILSGIYMLHMASIECDLKKSKLLIDQIEKYYEKVRWSDEREESHKILIPSIIMLESEKMLYSLFAGKTYKSNYGYDESHEPIVMSIDMDNVQIALERVDEENKKLIKRHNERCFSPNDAGFDVYQSLGYSSSMRGGWLLYCGNDHQSIIQSFQYFLKASYYFAQIGLVQRCARNIVLAGRAAIRIRDFDKAKACLNLSKNIIGNSSGNRPDYSSIDLLESEYELFANNNSKKAMELAVKNLNCEIWTGLGRRVADVLYAVWRCSLENNGKVKENLRAFLPSKQENPSIDGWVCPRIMSEIQESENTENFLDKIYKESDEETTWQMIGERFKEESADMWHFWFNSANETSGGKHPLGIVIEEKEFLKMLDP